MIQLKLLREFFSNDPYKRLHHAAISLYKAVGCAHGGDYTGLFASGVILYRPSGTDDSACLLLPWGE